MKNEPVLTAAGLTALAVAILALLVGVGVIDEDISALILGVVAAVIAIAGPIVRKYVSPWPPPPEEGD